MTRGVRGQIAMRRPRASATPRHSEDAVVGAPHRVVRYSRYLLWGRNLRDAQYAQQLRPVRPVVTPSSYAQYTEAPAWNLRHHCRWSEMLEPNRPPTTLRACSGAYAGNVRRSPRPASRVGPTHAEHREANAVPGTLAAVTRHKPRPSRSKQGFSLMHIPRHQRFPRQSVTVA